MDLCITSAHRKNKKRSRDKKNKVNSEDNDCPGRRSSGNDGNLKKGSQVELSVKSSSELDPTEAGLHETLPRKNNVRKKNKKNKVNNEGNDSQLTSSSGMYGDLGKYLHEELSVKTSSLLEPKAGPHETKHRKNKKRKMDKNNYLNTVVNDCPGTSSSRMDNNLEKDMQKELSLRTSSELDPTEPRPHATVPRLPKVCMRKKQKNLDKAAQKIDSLDFHGLKDTHIIKNAEINPGLLFSTDIREETCFGSSKDEAESNCLENDKQINLETSRKEKKKRRCKKNKRKEVNNCMDGYDTVSNLQQQTVPQDVMHVEQLDNECYASGVADLDSTGIENDALKSKDHSGSTNNGTALGLRKQNCEIKKRLKKRKTSSSLGNSQQCKEEKNGSKVSLESSNESHVTRRSKGQPVGVQTLPHCRSDTDPTSVENKMKTVIESPASCNFAIEAPMVNVPEKDLKLETESKLISSKEFPLNRSDIELASKGVMKQNKMKAVTESLAVCNTKAPVVNVPEEHYKPRTESELDKPNSSNNSHATGLLVNNSERLPVKGDGMVLQVLEDILVEDCAPNRSDVEPASEEQMEQNKMKSVIESTAVHHFDQGPPISKSNVPVEHFESRTESKLDKIELSMTHAFLGNEGVTHEFKINDQLPPTSQLGAICNDVTNFFCGAQRIPHVSPEKTMVDHSKKLIILDLNGLLADIVPFVPDGYTPDTSVSRKYVFKRPFCEEFLQFCFDKFNVGVWSSRVKKNVDGVVDFLMGDSHHKLLFCWDRSHCTHTGFATIENAEKPLVLKELKKLWDKLGPDLPWEKGEFNEANTLLLDDSPYKALRNPAYTAIFPETFQYADVDDNSLGPGGDLRVYLEGLAASKNVQQYVEKNPFGQRAITESNPSWGFYRKVLDPELCKRPRHDGRRYYSSW